MSTYIQATADAIKDRLDDAEWFRENFEQLIQDAFDAGLAIGYDASYDKVLHQQVEDYMKERNKS